MSEEQFMNESTPKRIYKYTNDEERHEVIKQQKLNWYYKKKDAET